MHKDLDYLPGRIKLIKLQMTLLHALESHTLSQRQWKGELPCVQITGYVSVCVHVWLILTLAVSLNDWCPVTNAHAVCEIQMHACIHARRQGLKGVLSRHRCNRTNAFLWVVSCWCVKATEFVYGVQGHAGWFSWSMFVYSSQRICLHMFHILGVFSFMRQQQQQQQQHYT